MDVKSGKETASYETELDIRPSNPSITDMIYGVINPGEGMKKSFALPGMSGTNSGILEVSSIPPIDFGRRLKYLVTYPHGCVEQVTSSAFPQLYLQNVMDVGEENARLIPVNVKAAIEKLGKFILPSGGFGYWPTSGTENEWGTCYAGHFLLKAREGGYEVPSAWITNWTGYQRKTARNWRKRGYQDKWDKQQDELVQAYRLYTLALAGAPELGAMNRLREVQDIYSLAAWRLAAAYSLAGQQETARNMVQNLTTETGHELPRRILRIGIAGQSHDSGNHDPSW